MMFFILYGLYNFLAHSGTGGDQTNLDSDLSIFVADAAGDLDKDDRFAVNKYIIERASEKWRNDPFAKIESPPKPEPETSGGNEDMPEAEEEQFPNIVYSGYLRLGTRMLAVINGMEYESGDILGIGGFVLTHISTTRIIVRRSWDNKKMTIPIQEVD